MVDSRLAVRKFPGTIFFFSDTSSLFSVLYFFHPGTIFFLFFLVSETGMCLFNSFIILVKVLLCWCCSTYYTVYLVILTCFNISVGKTSRVFPHCSLKRKKIQKSLVLQEKNKVQTWVFVESQSQVKYHWITRMYNSTCIFKLYLRRKFMFT